jgi:hydroxymethylpyrimidine/phosphomethylpyrimidine kinase
VEAVAAAIDSLELPDVVVDPVMIAKGGDRLLAEEAVAMVRTELLRRAMVATPNVPEAEVLADMRIRSPRDMAVAARRIHALGARVVVVKGGHVEGKESVDVVAMPERLFELRGPRIPGPHTHGTGCTFAAAIAANLALGQDVEQSLHNARAYLEGAIRHAPGLGRGHGPLDHFWQTRVAKT